MKSFVKIVLLLQLLIALPSGSAVVIDANVSKDLTVAASQITTAPFSTASPNELLLAFVATDATGPSMTVASVTGGGLTWELVARANKSSGTSEIWRAFSFSTLSGVTVTANLSQNVVGSLQILSFSGTDNSGINGAGAIGATAVANGGSGAPTASLTTTRAGSWVFGVGNDFTRAVARTVGAGQTIVHQDLSPTNDTYWVQRQNSTTPASGTKVTINDTAPTADTFNLAICEILAPGGTTAPALTSLAPGSGAAGTSVVLTGSNFGATQGKGGVTFHGTSSTISSWSATSITAIVPYGATAGNVVVTASIGLSSNGLSFAASPASGLAIDANASGDLLAPGTQLSTQTFSTTSGNEALLALIATDASATGMKVNSVSGGGLTWVLVKRTNTQSGDAEIWRAFAPSALSNVTVTAALAQSVVASIQVLSFTGADTSGTNGSGAIGATGSGNSSPGAPTANLITTRANSWVFGVGNDFDNSITRTVGPGQAITHQYWSITNDTYWMQRRNNTTPASGTTVTINDTAPATDKYNLSLVEILPSTGTQPAPAITSLAPTSGPVGTAVTISGSNFGATQGSSTVTFGGITAVPATWSGTSVVVPVPAGVALGPVPVVVTVSGAGSSNAVTFTVVAPLAISAFASPAANANGWNNTNVTVSYICSGGVPPVVCPAPVTVVTEGANQVISATAADANGSHASVSVTLNIDKTAPAITSTVTPPAGPNGVVVAPATITFVCSDGLSGVANCPGSITVTTPGSNQAFSGTATDRAGNQSTAHVTLNVEAAPLTITSSLSPLPNVNGWNNGNVTIIYQCSGGVPPVKCPASQPVTAEVAEQTFTSTATDAAGQSSVASNTLNIDKTPPAIAAAASPVPNTNGWNNTPVTIGFNCSDAFSGIDVCPTPVIVSAEGANQSVTRAAIDLAGNSATATVSVSLDQTPPSLIVSTTPPPDANGVSTGPVALTFTCSDALSGVFTCPASQTITSPGAQTITVTASDKAGNVTTRKIPLKIQSLPLQVATSVSPLPNAAGWNNTPVTVSFQCIGGVPPVLCPAPRVVKSDGANQKIHSTATDAAGHSTFGVATVSLDQAPPLLSVTSPISNNVTTGQVSLQGLVLDALSGTASVICDGAAATLAGTAFSCNLALTPGANAIAVTATDVAGNTSNANFTLNFVNPIHVHITSPGPQQLFSANPITVSGTVDSANATITVGDVAATVSAGVFTATGVVLRESKNLLTVSATDPNGGVGSDTVVAYLDTTPPVIHIDSPVDGSGVLTSQIDVTGNVNDSVTGTVNPEQVSITVNGVTSDVANRSFAGHNILLVPGVNTITAVATDRAGNVSQHQIHVTLQPSAALQSISIVSGNNQRAAIRSVLPRVLMVQTADSIGRPLPNVALTFAVSKSDGLLISGQQQGRVLTVQTDANGNASVQFRIGSRNGMGINQVSVNAPGFVGPVVFTADSVAGSPTQIHTVAGELQTGAVGASLPESLTAIVSDAGGNPVPNVPVTFTVRTGGGLIGGQSVFIQSTDNDGKASAELVLGQQEGISNNLVSASFEDLTGSAAIFRSSGVVPGPVANTTVSGVVLDDANEPIVNATASIKGTNLSALTNASGRFTIAGAPVGDIVLFVDGSTSTDPESYPTLSFQMATIPGIDNTLPGPIFLPGLDSDNSQVVGGDQDVVLTMKNVPGVEYKVFAHSVTFPDGSHTGRLTLSQVHADRVPMTPPNGTAPRLVGTLQPAGVKFDPPIQMTLPNTDGLAPGQVTEIFSFHHDVEQFVVEGTARVSDDGSVLITDTGFGLTVSGWHGGGGTPPPPTCADGCDAGDSCQQGSCEDGSCQFTEQPDGTSCQTDDACLVHGACSGGSCSGDQITISAVDVLADGNDPDAVAVNQPVSFTAAVTQQNCDQLTFAWDFGDGSSSSDQNPVHQYAAIGTYNASVNVTCGSCDENQQNSAEVDVVSADVNINNTADASDDITVLNPPMSIPVTIQLHGGPASVKLKVSPDGRATLDRDTLDLAKDGSDTVNLTPVAVSGSVDDVTITVSVNGNQIGTGKLTIADVKIPTIRNPNTPSTMTDRIPPRVDTPIHVTVAPDLGTSGKKVHLILKNNDATNGDLTIDGGTTKDITTTADVPLRGTVQTAPTGAPGGGNASKINIVAQVGGHDAVTSGGFSVSSIPVSFSTAFSADINGGGAVGMQVTNSWTSDSGVLGDLNAVTRSEQIQVVSFSGVFGGAPSTTSGFIDATLGSVHDNHSSPAAVLTGNGTRVANQVFIMNDLRTGATNAVAPNSGFVITRTAKLNADGSVTFVTAKSGAAVTSNGYTSTAGAGNASNSFKLINGVVQP